MIAVYFNQSQDRRENIVEQEALTFAPKTFQEWPSVKLEYGRYTGVLFGFKVTQKSWKSLRIFLEGRQVCQWNLMPLFAVSFDLERKVLSWSSSVGQHGSIGFLRFSPVLQPELKQGLGKFWDLNRKKHEQMEKYNFSARVWSTTLRLRCCQSFR